MTNAQQVPECLACGACCHTRNPRLVELMGVDAINIPDAYVEQSSDGHSHMRMVAAAGRSCLVCSALGAQHVCQIYTRRPFLCREFERGGPECLQAVAGLAQTPATA